MCASVIAADDAAVRREENDSQETLEEFPLDDTREDNSADPEERNVDEDTEDGGHSNILNT